MASWLNATTIEGLPEVMAKLATTDAESIARTGAALMEAGNVIAERAKANAADHRWTGRLESKVQVAVRGPLTVVVRSATPGGSALEFGWTSQKGLQPPSGPRSRLVKWLTAKGAPEPQRLAFVVARSIGEHGYSFPPTHWMGRAAQESREEVLATVATGAKVL